MALLLLHCAPRTCCCSSCASLIHAWTSNSLWLLHAWSSVQLKLTTRDDDDRICVRGWRGWMPALCCIPREGDHACSSRKTDDRLTVSLGSIPFSPNSKITQLTISTRMQHHVCWTLEWLSGILHPSQWSAPCALPTTVDRISCSTNDEVPSSTIRHFGQWTSSANNNLSHYGCHTARH